MQSHRSFRLHDASPRQLFLCGAFVALALRPSALQAQLPASTSAASSAAALPARQPHQSSITFANGLLTVTASNASLNGLIREIARQTGMKVSGSVAEDRVFGTYGPADPQRVLATLLDGTGSNILILSSATDAPLELILTPRQGAATPPNPNGNGTFASNDQDDDNTPAPGTPVSPATMRARPAVLPGSTPVGQNAGATSSSPQAETEAAPPAGSGQPAATTDTSTTSDGVKTPQQIFEQLQRLRQQSNQTVQTRPQPTSPQ